MSRNIPFEGFVIKKQQLLDASYLVTFFSKSQGKIKMIAKGIKKITSKRASHLQTGNKLKWFASKHISGMWYIGSTNLTSGLFSLKTDLNKAQALYHALQILDLLLPENQEEKYTFSAFCQFLTKANHGTSDDTPYLVLGFARLLISRLGYGDYIFEDFLELRKRLFAITGVEVDFQRI